jgi:dTDP-4-amino-4,6-dideoxygalactose transaminase
MIEYENLNKVNRPYFEEFKKVINGVLESGWFILGKNVEEFEKEFAGYNKVKYCVGVGSGFDALLLSLMALDFNSKTEIIVPSNTYIATILSIVRNGNKPVLVEPDLETYNIDPARIEEAITTKTRAIMIVHLYGKPCDMDPIMDICKRHNLFLIEDCAQSHGAEYKGKRVGSFGNVSAFSFYPTKNLGCLGDGGAVLTDDEQIYNKVRMLRNYGSSKKYYFDYLGLNSRLDEIQAAFLRIKLKHLDQINNHKRSLAGVYLEKINRNYLVPQVNYDFYDVYHIFNIRHRERDKIQDYLLSNEIITEIHYPVPPHMQKSLAYLSRLKLPISEEIHKTTLSLPISGFHTIEDINLVTEILNRYHESA